MSKINLHIYPTTIKNQNRLFKEAQYTLNEGLVDRVIVLGLWHPSQESRETLVSGLEVIRFRTVLRVLRDRRFVKHVPAFRKILAGISLIQYICFALSKAMQMRPEHIACHYVAMLPVAWAAARLSGATLEYLPHELETERSGLTGMKKKLETWIERRFIHSARNVVVVCDPIRDWYESAYGLKNLHVVRNVPERESAQIREISEGGFRQKFAISDRARVFIYQGLFSAGRGIDALLAAFKNLDPAKCHIVFMGYGEEAFEKKVTEGSAAYENIHFQPAVSRDMIVSYSASADIGIFISEKASLSYQFSLPNKFFEWAHAALPILVSDNLKYQADLLANGGFGWSTSLDKLQRTLLELSEIDLTAYIDNAQKYAASAVWEEDAKAFAQVYRRTTD